MTIGHHWLLENSHLERFSQRLRSRVLKPISTSNKSLQFELQAIARGIPVALEKASRYGL